MTDRQDPNQPDNQDTELDLSFLTESLSEMTNDQLHEVAYALYNLGVVISNHVIRPALAQLAEMVGETPQDDPEDYPPQFVQFALMASDTFRAINDALCMGADALGDDLYQYGHDRFESEHTSE